MILTVSRQLGSDGESIARSVAATLGLAVVDREVIRAAALKSGVPPELLQRLMYAGQRTVAEDIIQGLGNVTTDVAVALAGNPLLGVFAPPVSSDMVSLQDAAKAIGEIIKGIALGGDCLILGQGSQALLRDQPGACHILFVAPLAVRITNLTRWHNLSPREARRRIRNADEARSDYLARYYGVRWLDPLLYHLVINTGQVAADDAAALVIRAAQAADKTDIHAPASEDAPGIDPGI